MKFRRVKDSNLMELARDFNDDIQPFLKKSESLDFPPLDTYATAVGMGLWKRGWHYTSGKKVEGLPFELKMAGLSLLSTAWVADIFNRKARDRKSAMMLWEYLRFKAMLLANLNYIEYEVWRHADKKAERAYIAELVKYKQDKTLRKLGLLPPKPWWKRLKWWSR